MNIEIPSIENKIHKLFEDLLREDWMTDDELNELIQEVLQLNGINMDKLLKQFLIGVENGYTIEEQFLIIKEIFKNE